MFLNSWSAVLKGRVCSTRKTEKRSSSFTTFWFKFAVAELAPKSVNFLHRYAASTYPCALRCPCVYWYLCLLSIDTVHDAKPSPFRDFWINLNLLNHESLNFTQYFLFFDGTGSELSAMFFAMCRFFSRYRFYLVLIGKLGLNENRIRSRLGGMDIGQKIWKS